MRMAFTFLIVFTCQTAALSQTRNNSKIGNGLSESDTTVAYLGRELATLKKDLLDIKSDSRKKDDIIAEYRHLISLFEWGVGFLLALFGIIIPFATYFTQFKPSRETLISNHAELE